MSLLKRSGRLVLATLILAAPAAGLAADAEKAAAPAAKPAPGAASEETKWRPHALQPGEYYKYEIVDYTYKNTKGWVTATVKAREKDKLVVDWEAQTENGQKKSATVSEIAAEYLIRARPAVMALPGGTALALSVLAEWWEKVEGFTWNVGASWSVVYGEMAPAAFILKVDGRCEVAGHKGFKGRMLVGKTVMSESCVSPKIPLPLWVKANDRDNIPRYEAKLVEYRAPAPAKQ